MGPKRTLLVVMGLNRAPGRCSLESKIEYPITYFPITSAGARAMHGFGAEVFIEEAQ